MPDNLEDLREDDALDTEAAVAEISADLFGQGKVDGDGEQGKEPANPSAVETPPAPQTETAGADAPKPEEGDNSAAVIEAGAPKTWSKEALAEWATLSPRAQQEVLKREEDYLKGITMYKDRAEVGDKYSEVVAPYKPILDAENIDPVQIFQSFAANHYLLSRGTEAQKIELAAAMLSGYGIDFSKLASHIGDQLLSPPDPELAALKREIAELKQGITSRQQQEQSQSIERLTSEIEAFAADPSHPYFNELSDDIAKLFESGQAKNLQEAYDTAVYLNPTTRQKEIDRLTAEKSLSSSDAAKGKQAKIAQATAADLSLEPKTRNGTIAVGTLDDTLLETMARIQGRA